MNLTEFKKQLFEDLWEVFQEQFFVYKSDKPQDIDNVKTKINSLIESIHIIDDTDLTEEEIDKLTVNLSPYLFKSDTDDFDQEDLEHIGEILWFELVEWTKKDHLWYLRRKDDVDDDYIEDGLYSE